MNETTPRETSQDVFLLLLDAYREAQDYHLRNLSGLHGDRFDALLAERRSQIDATCRGWRVRYEAAAKQEAQP